MDTFYLLQHVLNRGIFIANRSELCNAATNTIVGHNRNWIAPTNMYHWSHCNLNRGLQYLLLAAKGGEQHRSPFGYFCISFGVSTLFYLSYRQSSPTAGSCSCVGGIAVDAVRPLR